MIGLRWSDWGPSCPSVSFERLFCFVKFNVCCCCINLNLYLFCFLGLLFSGDGIAESPLLLLELLRLVEWCRTFLELDLVAGICQARLLTAFARVAIDFLFFLYSSSSLKTLSEVSIVAVLLILLLDCSGWATEDSSIDPRRNSSLEERMAALKSSLMYETYDLKNQIEFNNTGKHEPI